MGDLNLHQSWFWSPALSFSHLRLQVFVIVFIPNGVVYSAIHIISELFFLCSAQNLLCYFGKWPSRFTLENKNSTICGVHVLSAGYRGGHRPWLPQSGRPRSLAVTGSQMSRSQQFILWMIPGKTSRAAGTAGRKGEAASPGSVISAVTMLILGDQFSQPLWYPVYNRLQKQAKVLRERNAGPEGWNLGQCLMEWGGHRGETLRALTTACKT